MPELKLNLRGISLYLIGKINPVKSRVNNFTMNVGKEQRNYFVLSPNTCLSVTEITNTDLCFR